MSSYGLLPQILNPTREIGNSSTIIDNIFTNNISNSIQSGNILTDLSDHYSQFIMVNRDILDVKTRLVYSRDYSFALPPDVRITTSFGLFKTKMNRYMTVNYNSNI